MIGNDAGALSILCGIEPGGAVDAATIGLAVGGQEDVAAIVEQSDHGGRPLQAQIGSIEREQVGGAAAEVSAAHGVESGTVRGNCGRDVQAGALRSAVDIGRNGIALGGQGNWLGENVPGHCVGAPGSNELKLTVEVLPSALHLHDPGVDYVAIPGPGEHDLHYAVINVALVISGEASGDELCGIFSGAEGIDLLQHDAGGFDRADKSFRQLRERRR